MTTAEDMHVTCPSCGWTITFDSEPAGRDDGARFCITCGTPLVRVCADCGFDNDPANKFCGGCGHTLNLGTEGRT